MMVSASKAVDKFFSLGVLTFTTHCKQFCAVAMCYILQIQIWGCFSTPKHPLVYGLGKDPCSLSVDEVVVVARMVKLGKEVLLTKLHLKAAY